MKRSEKRRILRKKFSRKSRLNFERGTERTWMECYRGDRRRLRLQRRQGSNRHQPKAVRNLGRPCMLSREDLEWLDGYLDELLGLQEVSA